MADLNPLDSAHEKWDEYWQDASVRAHWEEAEPAVLDTAPLLRDRGATRVLDLGAGVGRNALALAGLGFEVIALDASDAGLAVIAGAGAGIGVARCRFAKLPLADGSIDHVVAWNVLYHGDGAVFEAALRECRRVLHAHATLQFTMLSKRHRRFGAGEEIEPDTFVDHAGEGDKAHPHFFVDAPTLTASLARTGFETLSLVDVDQCPPGKRPGQWHWTVLAEAVTPPRHTGALGDGGSRRLPSLGPKRVN